VDHRVEPPSWLPQGAAPQAAGPEADEAPASDDAHAPRDDSAPAEGTAEEFPNGNGHESSYAYLPGDAHIYQDSPYTDHGALEEPTRPPFDDLPGASFDQSATPPPPGDQLTGTAFGGGVTVGAPESGYSSAAGAGVPDGGFSGSSPGADAPTRGFGGSATGGVPDGGFTGSGFTGSAYTGSPAGPDLRDDGFSSGVAGAGGPAGSGPAAGSPYTEHYSPGFSESPAPAVAAGPGIASQSTQQTGTYPYPPPPAPASPPARGKQPTSSARRANLIVARLEPWSVMKFSFLISLVAWIVLFVAVALLYYALSSLGVFASLQKTLASVTSSQGSAGVDLSRWTSGTRIMGYTMLLGAVDVVLITALSTLGAVVYNLVTHLGGGIEITLKETE